MIENVIPLPDGGKWIVRAYAFPTAEAAKKEWERVQGGEHAKADPDDKGNFSLWRVANPEQTRHLVVTCARPEHLPEIRGGELYALTQEEAEHFAIRRARVGLDAGMDTPGAEHHSQEARYGEDSGKLIDPATGYLKEYRQR